MNRLHVGLHKTIEPPKGGFLLISDAVRDFPDWRRPKTFEPLVHSFNPLKGLDYKAARQIADVLYTIYPQGENTLTVRNGRRALLRSLLDAKRLDEVQGDEEVSALISDVLASPVLKRVFCEPPNFTFNRNSVNQAHLSRADLGDFDALVLGLFLMAHFKGQLVVEDFGFYGREAHVSLVREERLIAGVNFLGELSPKLRRAVLLVEDKRASGATYDDAVELAAYAGIARDTVEWHDFIKSSMG